MRLVSSAILIGAVLVSVPVRGDSLEGTRFELRERAHRATVTVDRGFARIVVQRTIQNDGARSDQATYWLGVPEGGVATGLRTLGASSSGAPMWFNGELMEAEAAAAKYKELTGLGGFTPKDPALLSWRSQSLLALQVFPVLPKSEKVVEYTMLVPTRYESGFHGFTVPGPSGDAAATATAAVFVRAARPGDRVFVNGVPASEAPVRLDADLTVKLKPGAGRPLEGSLASFTMAKDRVMTHARVHVAARISEVPNGAAVVVVLDASRSARATIASEAALVRAYLSHFKNASVDVLTFDRAVHRLTPRPVPTAAAIALLYAAIPVANGSRVDDALAEADALLSARPERVKRLLLVSDLRTRTALDVTRLALTKRKSDAIVHVATVSDGRPALSRDDDSTWARLPQATGGVYWQASHPDRVDAASRAAMEALARPVTIDGVAISGLETPLAPLTDGALHEGQGLEAWSVDALEAKELTIDGMLWSTPTRFRIGAEPAEVRRSAALAFGSSLLGELRPAEMTALAFKGGAVSPVTSYLAIEPGVRPSTDGLEESGAGEGFRTKSPSIRMGATSVHRRADVDHEALLKTLLAPLAKSCGARGGMHVTLETTSVEIVDVTRIVHTPARDVAVEACLREAVWKLDLPEAFDVESMTYEVDVTPA